MAKEFKMVISPDGKVLTSVYNDILDISKIGTPEINRATEVCYNNEKKYWEIKLLKPIFADEFVLAKGFKSRADAIEYEVAFLNTDMEKIIANTRSSSRGS